MMIYRVFPLSFLLLGLLLPLCAVSQRAAAQPATDSLSPIPFAKPIVDTLSSPAFAGRGYLNDADGKAADYIENYFKRIGLSPISDTYQQPFPLTVDVYPTTPTLSLGLRKLDLGHDYLPFPGSSSGTATTARIVEVGDGLFVPNTKYNNYAGKNVEQAVVVMDLEITPDVLQAIRADSTINPALAQTTGRIEIARYLGAVAVILRTSNNLLDFYTPVNTGIPAFVVADQVWLENGAATASFTLETTLDWQTTSSNVIGYIPGTTTPEEYYFISAHYDHMGQLGPDHYFPGANDNASGVALTLALAAYFQQKPLKRSLVFVGFSGEEEGLIGSRYFVDNPPLPLESIRFLVNLDMVASGSQGIMAVGGSDFNDEFDLLASVGDTLNIGPIGKRPNAPISDHYFFLNAGVRGFFLYTNKGDQPYHHPEDVAATLDWQDFADTYALVRTFLMKLDKQ
ncbi:MAG: M28 family peptidase [Bacteroidota bacterium]